MRQSPIFIHSLFRSGSTYLFKVFRRSSAGYFCFQEALHEYVSENRLTPDFLLKVGPQDAKKLRHPELGDVYWSELVSVWPAWSEAINDEIIYDQYFASKSDECDVSFWLILAQVAKSRAVFQECRTAGRIHTLKDQIGGVHIYLWRNPWDQWWSYKVTPYFDVANQVIVNSRRAPLSARLMLEELSLPSLKDSGLRQSLDFYAARPLTSEQSYMTFYLLWCLALREGLKSADVTLNIDSLSDSLDYKNSALKKLENLGIDGINFSDCRVPQGRYLKQDKDFFAPLEVRVHQWLAKDGWSDTDIETIQTLRRKYQPASWNIPIENTDLAENAEQIARARDLAIRFETQVAERSRIFASRLSEFEFRIQAAKFQAQKAEAYQQQAGDLEIRLRQLQIRLDELGFSNDHLWQLASALETERDAMKQSASWRITVPLRFAFELASRPIYTLRTAANGFIHRTINAAERPLARAIAAVLGRPQLSQRINQWLFRYPALYQQLASVARRRGVVPNPSAYLEATKLSPVHATSDLVNLTPRALEIYDGLKAAIEKKGVKR